jgi:tripartite-type tricarboxylate transporter receptor subunit TctC
MTNEQGRMTRRAVLGVVLAAVAAPALAQGTVDWPRRPIRIIVAQPPGGNLDILVRAIAEGLRAELNTPVVVENRAGGNGVIGLEACAQSAPDGTTFCAVNIENMASVPHVEPELFARYASLRPVSQMAGARSVIVASLDAPPGDLRDFVSWARGQTGLNYGSSGSGSAQQLLFEWLKARDGLQIEHIPFRGIGDAFRELLGGRIQLSYGALALAMPQIRSGRIRPLAVLGSQRIAELPETPSLGELGYAFPYAGPWWGMAAPGATPEPIVGRMSAAVRSVVTNEEFAARALAPQYFTGIGSTPEEFAAVIGREREASLELVRLAGLVQAR